MKGFIMTVTMLLILTMIIAVIPTESEADIYADTVRLHILARSDSEEDQAVKLEIRDRLLEKYGSSLSEYNSPDEARESLEGRTEEIKRDVNLWLGELGCDYTAEVVIDKEWYDTRKYDGFTLPAGEYTSLRILLGDGEGKNWWCVMFPPLCLDVASDKGTSNGNYTEAENKLITEGEYKIKFKILELASGTVKNFSEKVDFHISL